jgi:hypothetical protein
LRRLIVTIVIWRLSDKPFYSLSASSGENHLSLQLQSPDDRTSGIADGTACSGLGHGRIIRGIFLIPVTCKVAINVNLEGLGDIRAQYDAFILGAQEIPAEVLTCISMGHCIFNFLLSILLQKVQLANDAMVVPLLLKR